MDRETVVLGGGLAGLSCAFHLGERPYRLYEAATSLGGLCHTRHVKGFHFDATGHLLHLRDPSMQKLILEELLPGVMREHVRKAFIHSRGKFTPYPFQANTYGLPREVVRDCVVGYVEAPRIARPRSFEQWALTTFGAGIYQHFLQPYNEKLWGMPLSRVTHEWCSWSVPRPTLAEIVDGAIGNTRRGMGYNATFYYPREGGIEVLPLALARRCRNLAIGHRAVAIDARRCRVTFENGETAPYRRLVSTLPLDELLAMIRGGRPEWRAMAKGLRRVPILCLNLGVRGRFLPGKHWVYFPEKRFPFYRVGVASNFSAALAPAGCSNLYVEVSLAEREPDVVRITSACLEALDELGMPSEIVTKDVLLLPCAYVLYDRFRARAVPVALRQLRECGILSTGRYGGWKYSYMERAILDGREAAAWAAEA